jgi:hypothetical protein
MIKIIQFSLHTGQAIPFEELPAFFLPYASRVCGYIRWKWFSQSKYRMRMA